MEATAGQGRTIEIEIQIGKEGANPGNSFEEQK
jgi:hypothetical protein